MNINTCMYLACTAPSENESLWGCASIMVMVTVQLHLVVYDYKLVQSNVYPRSACTRTVPQHDGQCHTLTRRALPSSFFLIFNPGVLELHARILIPAALSKLSVLCGLWISHHFHSKHPLLKLKVDASRWFVKSKRIRWLTKSAVFVTKTYYSV